MVVVLLAVAVLVLILVARRSKRKHKVYNAAQMFDILFEKLGYHTQDYRGPKWRGGRNPL